MVAQPQPVSPGEAVLDALRERLIAGAEAYNTCFALAESMSRSQVLALWKEEGGTLLYAWAIGRLGKWRRQCSQRRPAGLPMAYNANPAQYCDDRRKQLQDILASFVGVLGEDGKVKLVMIGLLDAEGCRGAAANYSHLARANETEAKRYLRLAAELEARGAERLSDLDLDVLAALWWG